MTQEPRSFFERLTGARILNEEDEMNSQDQSVPVHEAPAPTAEFATRDMDDTLEEVEEDMEEEMSDEESVAGAEGQEGQLTVDVFQDDTNIIIQSTVAGVMPDDLDVSITNDMVTIRGERKQQYEASQADYFYQECYWGTFSRSIILPVEIDADNAEAKIKNGVLTIRIPKANVAITRKLQVKAS